MWEENKGKFIVDNYVRDLRLCFFYIDCMQEIACWLLNFKDLQFFWPKALVNKWFIIKRKDHEFHANEIVEGYAGHYYNI